MSGAFESLDVAVVGGGISGLAAAHVLRKAGRNVAVLEAAGSFGGCIGSLRAGPYLADRGPQSFIAAPPLVELLSELGLQDQVVKAGGAGAKRYVYRHGALILVPMSPGAFIATPLLSAGAKWRLLAEPFIAKRAANEDESAASFLTRRAGAEFVEAVAAPVMSGIYAGDPARLSARSTMPGLVRFEQERGSVVRGLLARRNDDKTSAADGGLRGMIGLRGGNAALIDALVKSVEGHAYAGARVTRIRQRGAGFALECEGLPEGTIDAARVLVAAPAAAAADLLESLEPDGAAALREIEYAPVAQIVMAYQRADAGVPLDGFGFLACRGEGVRVLGAVWNSCIFPGRCPEGELLCTAFLGGALDLDVEGKSDEELARIAHEDLRRIMRMAPSKPNVVAGFRWSAAIPQYVIGHAARLGRISAAVARIPGLMLVGNYTDGLSTAQCIRRAGEAAATLSR